MAAFAAATLGPLALALAGAVWGGPWPWLALGAMTLLVAALDRVLAAAPAEMPDAEYPGSDALLAVTALGGLVLLGLVVRAAGGGTLSPLTLGALVLAAGLWLGQVGNACAHELIHRPQRALRRLGIAHYAALLFGHHASAHPLVHHVHVATDRDPNSAPLGQSFWRFAGRAWRGSFREGWRAESRRLGRAGRAAWQHPYGGYVLATVCAGALAWLLGGVAGVAVWMLIGLHASGQLLLTDYVQHYGLRRRTRPDGRPEPVDERHSWNSPHRASSALTFNAPRHSDHHAHPSRAYPVLALPSDRDAPRLPRSLPVMGTVALIPPLWRRMMDRRARRWMLPQG
ncbi:alkane 1-monooxygenase [Rubellimicrobium sp. CFH 75288]|uniref:alkane 1-monooxygenase n=1 Tax=Rubellimicrobium sp. CFH 75288 TaxID=2697034 RepID=UPI001412C851|nr:alkane 1-monooxygenase [Rubellimicrobium sp. CFH 75288]NAZ36424.1 alkane 1-monooxygenase [Rubellimicrobium sp. CFH 75288]